ncbi:MAG: hypothetical protein ACLT8P_07155 [Holdemanella porci]|uniref:hypothetical protein n=1 Tax=Holdemanella porci TaxID=2652276 RepID=UPI0039963486
MKTKQEYIDTLVCIIKEYYSTIRSPEETNKFNSYFRLFKELIDEHFKEKPETNFEHYFEYLSKLNMSDFALIDGRVVQCLGTHCRGCDFNGDCIERKFKWLKQPYEKLPYKLSQFEFDIIQTYRDCHESCKISEFKQLIELKDKGYFKCIDHDTKIQDVLENCEVIQ